MSCYPGSLFFLDIPIVRMIPINSLQELSEPPLPCGQSPSRPKLRHLLLCYTVPQVIHLEFPRFSRTRRIPETLSIFIVKASLRLALLRRPSNLCYLNTTYSKRSWLTIGLSWLSSGLLHAFQLDILHSSFLDRYFLLTCISQAYKIHETSSQL
jgi:hypothetical protein